MKASEQKSASSNNPAAAPARATAIVQPKLTINEPGDRYEQEADAMADRVMRMTATPPADASAAPGLTPLPLSGGVQRKCAECEKEEKLHRKEAAIEPPASTPLLMRKTASGGGVATPALTQQLGQSKGGGSPLPLPTLQTMSQAFGTDFSGVRVHTGSAAAQMNQGIQARAFTHGSDIYFNRGEYQPESGEGRRLLAHELGHVVQQGASRNIQEEHGGSVPEPKTYPQLTKPQNSILQRDIIQRDEQSNTAAIPEIMVWYDGDYNAKFEFKYNINKLVIIKGTAFVVKDNWEKIYTLVLLDDKTAFKFEGTHQYWMDHYEFKQIETSNSIVFSPNDEIERDFLKKLPKIQYKLQVKSNYPKISSHTPQLKKGQKDVLDIDKPEWLKKLEADIKNKAREKAKNFQSADIQIYPSLEILNAYKSTPWAFSIKKPIHAKVPIFETEYEKQKEKYAEILIDRLDKTIAYARVQQVKQASKETEDREGKGMGGFPPWAFQLRDEVFKRIKAYEKEKTEREQQSLSDLNVPSALTLTHKGDHICFVVWGLSKTKEGNTDTVPKGMALMEPLDQSMLIFDEQIETLVQKVIETTQSLKNTVLVEKKDLLPAYPASIKGPDKMVKGGIGVYKMMLNYEKNTLLSAVFEAHRNIVAYRWEIMDATSLYKKYVKEQTPSRPPNQSKQTTNPLDRASASVAYQNAQESGPDENGKVSPLASTRQRIEKATQNHQEDVTNAGQTLVRDKRATETGGEFFVDKWFSANYLLWQNIDFQFGMIRAFFKSLPEILAPEDERSVPFPNVPDEPAYFLVRGFATPVPRNEGDKAHKPSVAVKLVKVASAKVLSQEEAKDQKAAIEAQILSLLAQHILCKEGSSEEKEILESLRFQVRIAANIDKPFIEEQISQIGKARKDLQNDDPKRAKLNTQYAILIGASDKPATVLDIIGDRINQFDKKETDYKVRYGEERGTERFKEDKKKLERWRDKVKSQSNQGSFLVNEETIVPVAHFINDEDGGSYPLLLEIGRIRGGWKVIDHTLPNGDNNEYEAYGGRSGAILQVALAKFAGDLPYGRGYLSVILPDGGDYAAVKRTTWRCAPSSSAKVKESFDQLIEILTIVGLFVPVVGVVVGAVSAAGAAARLFRKYKVNNLYFDEPETILDLVNIIGAVASGVGALAKLRIKRIEGANVVAAMAEEFNEMDALLNNVKTVNPSVTTATTVASIAEIIEKSANNASLMLINAELIDEFLKTHRKQLHGEITATQAWQEKMGYLVQGIRTNAIQFVGMNHKSEQRGSNAKPEPNAQRGTKEAHTKKPQEAPKSEKPTVEQPRAKTNPIITSRKGIPSESSPPRQQARPHYDPSNRVSPPAATGGTPKHVPPSTGLPEKDHVVLISKKNYTPGQYAIQAKYEFEKRLRSDPHREVALCHNPFSGEWVIIQGAETSVNLPVHIPEAMKAAGVKGMPSDWILEAHSHPNEQKGGVSELAKFPSGASGDFAVLIHLAQHEMKAQKSQIRHLNAKGDTSITVFGVDPTLPKPLWIAKYDLGNEGITIEKHYFSTLKEYHQFLLKEHNSPEPTGGVVEHYDVILDGLKQPKAKPGLPGAAHQEPNNKLSELQSGTHVNEHALKVPSIQVGKQVQKPTLDDLIKQKEKQLKKAQATTLDFMAQWEKSKKPNNREALENKALYEMAFSEEKALEAQLSGLRQERLAEKVKSAQVEEEPFQKMLEGAREKLDEIRKKSNILLNERDKLREWIRDERIVKTQEDVREKQTKIKTLEEEIAKLQKQASSESQLISDVAKVLTTLKSKTLRHEMALQAEKRAALGITPELYARLRKESPSKAIRELFQRFKVDWIYGFLIQGVTEADHLLSMNQITQMAGFRRLTFEQQVMILNHPDNFIALDKRVNASKGDRSISEWSGHPEFGEIRKEKRDSLIETENKIRERIQKTIFDQIGLNSQKN